jgi:hypothetical protein
MSIETVLATAKAAIVTVGEGGRGFVVEGGPRVWGGSS